MKGNLYARRLVRPQPVLMYKNFSSIYGPGQQLPHDTWYKGKADAFTVQKGLTPGDFGD